MTAVGLYHSGSIKASQVLGPLLKKDIKPSKGEGKKKRAFVQRERKGQNDEQSALPQKTGLSQLIKQLVHLIRQLCTLSSSEF